MKRILITRKLITSSEERAKKIFDVKLNKEDKILTKEQLIKDSEGCDGILSSLTEKFDSDLISELPKTVKIISNFAVGYGNIDLVAAKKKNIVVTNTPDVLTDATAEIAMLILLGAARRAKERMGKEKKLEMVSRFSNGKTINRRKTRYFRNGENWKGCCKYSKIFWNDYSLSQ